MLVFQLTSLEMKVFILSVWIIVSSIKVFSEMSDMEHYFEKKMNLLKRKYRPLYHISAPVGWLNNPSGFVYFKQQYHIFYQYHPYRGAWDPLHCGHVTSDNLVEWAFYPPALLPKEPYDKHGYLAGSAVVHNNYLTIFYTGNLIENNKTYQSQNVAISSDGVIFQKYLYNPIIRTGPFGSSDFRNPRVWRYKSSWYMLIGTSKKREAHLLLYTSPDLFNWKLNATLAKSYGNMGYMWETPDFFELDGFHVLIISVQGINTENFRFRNIYQTGYFIGHFNYSTSQFDEMEISAETFNELDYGHDFYAATTMKSVDGRRLLVGWLGIWDYEYEESNNGWASMLTLVRELKLNKHGKMLMTPVHEITELRTEVLEKAWYNPGEAFFAGSRAFELIVNASTVMYDASIILEWNDDVQYLIIYSAEKGHITVDRGGVDGVRRADWRPTHHIHWRMFIDYSSIEVFCGRGEVVFTSRIYPKRAMRVRIAGDTQLHITQYRLRRSIGYNTRLAQELKNKVFNKYR